MYNQLDYRNRVVVGLIISFALLFFMTGTYFYLKYLPVVTLKVDSVKIRQDEAIPELKVHAEFSGKRDIVLDEETGYKISDFVNEFNQGKGYQLKSDIDNTTEGVYSLEIELDSSIQEKLIRYWNFRVRCEIEDGTCEVLNKYGDWDDGKFTFFDGTQGAGWTNIGSDTYYFDEEGKRVEGKQEILGAIYYFGKDGKFDQEKNKVNPAKTMIAITFDDGPGPYTMQLLEVLEAYDARATFFMVGTNVSKYPETIKKMKEIGCELGNHTTNHARLTELDVTGIQNEVQTTNQAIQDIVGEEATVVRPPYGAYNEVVQSGVSMPLIIWSIDTLDWKTKDAVQVRDYVLSTAKDGEIILLHDIHETTLQAAMEFIPKLIEQGYQLVTVSELASARGVTLEDGQIYGNFRK